MPNRALTLAEYFDTFYPEAWGDWREGFNIAAYRKNPMATGCGWEDLSRQYLVTLESDGVLACRHRMGNSDLIEQIFVPCGDLQDESSVARFIQPARQPDGTCWANVTLSRVPSNLDLYEVFVVGNDDSSYTKHFLGLDAAIAEMDLIRDKGIWDIQEREYFFTN